MQFTLQPPTRRCAGSGRAIKAGERFHGVLVADGSKFARLDFAPEAWSGPPESAVAHWVGRVPDENAVRRPAFDDETLGQCFRQLDGVTDAAEVNFRYVLALLLMRRKRLRLVEERADAAGSIMVFTELKDGRQWEVRDPHLTEAELQEAQESVFRLVGWD